MCKSTNTSLMSCCLSFILCAKISMRIVTMYKYLKYCNVNSVHGIWLDPSPVRPLNNGIMEHK